MMKVQLAINTSLDLVLFDIEEAGRAQAAARQVEGTTYSWKTTGRANWLEKGLSVVDVLGLVVLPKGLPPVVEMPDDIPE